MIFNFALHLRPTSAARRCLSSLSFVKRPCFRLAAEMRCKPSMVLGPVLKPPWREHLPLILWAGLWHSVPRRVLAPHLSPCQLGPNRVARPNSEISFVTIIFSPIIECYIITFVSTSLKCSHLVFYWWLFEPNSVCMDKIIYVQKWGDTPTLHSIGSKKADLARVPY